MSVYATRWAALVPHHDLTPLAHRVLVILALTAEEHGTDARAPQSWLCEKLGVTQAGVSKAFRELREKGYIKLRPHVPGRSHVRAYDLQTPAVLLGETTDDARTRRG